MALMPMFCGREAMLNMFSLYEELKNQGVMRREEGRALVGIGDLIKQTGEILGWMVE